MENHISFFVDGKLVDILSREIRAVRVRVTDKKIAAIEPLPDSSGDLLPYLLPGFVDAHVHIESSMLIPSEFARLAVVHGTVATVSDPHEIANVCGERGVRFMIENGKKVPFKFSFGAPSCVPATSFETAGATLDEAAVARLLEDEEVRYLSEMMNFPGVLMQDPVVMKKIEAAKRLGKPVDGHAPGLMGDAAQAYIDAGISTDHECFSYEEALDKLKRGMKVIIREGSAARNFETLIPLLDQWHHQLMFCSDDKHPDSLELGHINQLCTRAVANGNDVFKVLQVACINPVIHYALPVGLLRVGDPADFIAVKDLENFEVLETYIDGSQVAKNGKTLIGRVEDPDATTINNFNCSPVSAQSFGIPWVGQSTIPVIEALDGQLITNRLDLPPKLSSGLMIADPENDVLKIAVINRYQKAPIAIAFIRNLGLRKGAIASSVAHDSHNIVVAGCDDYCMARAANLIIMHRGGVSATDGSLDMQVALPVAGLMSADDGYQVARRYTELDNFSKNVLGANLRAPFMTLSFMALLVIPHLKLSDLGLFNGDKFEFISNK